MLWAVTSVKLVCEVALMAALGRAVLGRLLAPAQRADNAFHRLLGWVVAPAERLAGRWALPLLLSLWALATLAKIALCLDGSCR